MSVLAKTFPMVAGDDDDAVSQVPSISEDLEDLPDDVGRLQDTVVVEIDDLRRGHAGRHGPARRGPQIPEARGAGWAPPLEPGLACPDDVTGHQEAVDEVRLAVVWGERPEAGEHAPTVEETAPGQTLRVVHLARINRVRSLRTDHPTWSPVRKKRFLYPWRARWSKGLKLCRDTWWKCRDAMMVAIPQYDSEQVESARRTAWSFSASPKLLRNRVVSRG